MEGGDALFLARVQFGLNIAFHILFPSLSIGLAWILLFFRVRYAQTGDAAIRVDVEAHVRPGMVGEFRRTIDIEIVVAVATKGSSRQHQRPRRSFRCRDRLGHGARRIDGFQREVRREVACEETRVDVDAANLPAGAEFDDAPVVARCSAPPRPSSTGC